MINLLQFHLHSNIFKLILNIINGLKQRNMYLHSNIFKLILKNTISFLPYLQTYLHSNIFKLILKQKHIVNFS